MNDPHTEGVLIRHGIKPKVRCRAGETFEQSEKRLFREDIALEWNPGKERLYRIVENMGLAPDALPTLKNILSDFEGDFINVDPRKEE